MANTVKDYIVTLELNSSEKRLARLKEIGAPDIIIRSLSKTVSDLKNGRIKIGGDSSALEEEFICSDPRKGRGGKVYFSINDGKINYFPEAKYGKFIKYA